MIRDLETARKIAQQSCRDTLEPYVTIEWTEKSDGFPDIEAYDVMPLSEADKKLKALDKQAASRNGYFKTKLHIDFIIDGKPESYENCRYDIGSEGGGLVEHIKNFWTYRKENRDEYAGTDDAEYAEIVEMADKFAPYLQEHLDLSKLVEKAKSALDAETAGEPDPQISLKDYDDVVQYVRDCRTKLNGISKEKYEEGTFGWDVFNGTEEQKQEALNSLTPESRQEILEELSSGSNLIPPDEQHVEKTAVIQELETEINASKAEPSEPLSAKDKVNNIRNEMAQTILTYIEQNPLNWSSRWNNLIGGAPTNGKTGKAYRGLNALYLALSAMQQGYSDPRWVTYNQAQELGAQVKRGEKSSPVIFFEMYDRATKKAFDSSTVKDMTDEEKEAYLKENVYAVMKSSRVFNAAQCRDFPELDLESLKMSEEERAKQNAKIETIIANSEAPVLYDGGNRAYYAPSEDKVHLPIIEAFKSKQDYYATALHEIAHSTGHKSRLNRFREADDIESYAKEELRAELACVFMQMEQGIQLEGKHIENHAAYLKSWLKRCKDDPNVFYSAVRDAEKITDYIESNYLSSAKAAELEAKSESTKEKTAEDISTAESMPVFNRELPFAAQVDAAISNQADRYEVLRVCDTPQILIEAGFEDVPMTYSKRHLIEAIKPKNEDNPHHHGLTVGQIKSMPMLLKSPVMLFDTNENNASVKRYGRQSVIMLLNAFDNSGAPIIASVLPNGKNNNSIEIINSNHITSIYGKDKGFENFIINATNEGRVFFWDKEKTQELFSCAGLQLPGALNNLESNIIIRKAKAFVNTSAQNSLENSAEFLQAEEQKRETERETLHKVLMETSIKDWYKSVYPNDEAGNEIKETLSFNRLQDIVLSKSPVEVYEVLGQDAVVRERVFDKLAELGNVPYDTYHSIWSDNIERIKNLAATRERAKELSAKTGEPYVTITWAEGGAAFPGLKQNEVMPLSEADKIFKKLNNEIIKRSPSERAQVQLNLNFIFEGVEQSFDNFRYELGVESNGLIEAFNLYATKLKRNSIVHTENERKIQDYAIYFSQHRDLSEMIDKAKADNLPMQEQLNIQAYVLAARQAVNTTIPFSMYKLPEFESKNSVDANHYEKYSGTTSPMIQEYLKAQKENPTCVIAYRLGDFYEVFGKNAEILSEELNLTLTGRNAQGLTERIPMVGFPYHASESFFNKIAENHDLAILENGAVKYWTAQNNSEKETDDEIEDKARTKLYENAAFGYSLDRPELSLQDCIDAVSEMPIETVEQYAKEYLSYLDGSAELYNETEDEYYDAEADIRAEKETIEREAEESIRRAEFEENVREWYMNTYPTDKVGKEINPELTFSKLDDVLDAQVVVNIYDTIGVGDSLVRERLFEHLAKLNKTTYEEIYERWSNIATSRTDKNVSTENKQPAHVVKLKLTPEEATVFQDFLKSFQEGSNAEQHIYDVGFNRPQSADFWSGLSLLGEVKQDTLGYGVKFDRDKLLDKIEFADIDFSEADRAEEGQGNMEQSTNRTDKNVSTSNVQTKREWLRIDLSAENIMNAYGANTMIKMPEGEYKNFVFFVPTKMLKEQNGSKYMHVASDFKYRLNDDGKQVELTGQELKDSFEGKEIGKEYKRVAPSRRNAEQLARIEKNVPKELKEIPNWSVYRTVWNPERGKRDKYLHSAIDGKVGVKRTDASRWSDFDTALQFARDNNFEGLAFALDGKSGITCIDLDKCMDYKTGEMSQFAQRLTKELEGTYIEKSSSGTGLHMFVKDDILKGDKYKNVKEVPEVGFEGAGLEVYDNTFIISITGNQISKSNELMKCPTATTSFLRSELGEKERNSNKPYSKHTTYEYQSGSDREIIERIRKSKKGAEFDALFSGKGITGDKSRDDMKLANILAFFTNGDEAQSYSIFRASGQYRPDKPDSYYHHTISKAIESLNVRPQFGGGAAATNQKSSKKGSNK